MPINVADIPTANGSKSCTLSELDSIVKAQHLEWGSYDWAASGNLLLDLVKTAVASITPSYVKGVQAAFANAFGTRPPWRLQRFASMKAAFLDSTIPSVVEAALANCKPDIDRMVVNAFADYYQQTRPGYTFATLHKSIRGCILLQLQAATSDADKLLKQAPNVDQLKLHEDSLTAGQRHEHSAKLLQLQKAARTIEGIAAASPTGSSGSRVPAGAQTAEVHTDHNQTSSQLPVPAGPNKYVFTWLVCEDAQKPAESDDTWEPRTATPSTKRNRQDPKTGDGERKKVKHSVAK